METINDIGKVVPEKSDLAAGLHYVTCPLCGADRTAPVLSSRDYYNNLTGEFSIVRCCACGFAYTNPRPFGERLASYYPDSAAYYGQEELPEAETLRTSLAEPKVHRRLRQLGYFGGRSPASTLGLSRKVLKDGMPPFVAHGQLLEVGSASGAFLYQLQHLGWTCRGIEQNRAAAAHARLKLGLDVTVSTLEACALPEAGFDAMVMRMVLEHLPSPVAALATLNRALRPGGWLVFNVPNFGAPERRLFGRYTYALLLPQHLNHFTPDAIRALLPKTGFALDRICLTTCRHDFWGSVENRKWDLGERDPWVRLGRVKLVRRIGYGLWWVYARLTGEPSRMMVYARKPPPV